MCEYSNYDWKCPHKKLPDSKYCIFHLRGDEKDIGAFSFGIKKILRTEEEVIHFNGFYFPEGTSDFKRRVFEKDVDFRGAVFKGEANFWLVEFKKKTYFEYTVFNGKADFRYTEFNGEAAGFNEAEFNVEANFGSTKFNVEANFGSTKFNGEANFWKAEFKGEANFGLTKFNGEANFEFVIFSGYSNFWRAIFSYDAEFVSTEFYGITCFKEAKFSGEAHFKVAKFSGDVSFYSAEFYRDVYFGSTKFYAKTDFTLEEKYLFSWNDVPGNDSAKLMEHLEQPLNIAWVKDAIIEKDDTGEKIIIKEGNKSIEISLKQNEEKVIIKISSNKTYEYTVKREDGKLKIFTKLKGISFEDAFFSDNVRIRSDLSECSFYHSNIEKVDLTDSKWPDEYKKWHIFPEGIKIREEIEGWLPDKEVEGIYRRLKQSYQRYGDYSTAGKFYYREMECKRKEMGFFRGQFWNISYRVLCGYGENPLRVFGFSVIFILLFAVFYFFSGIMLVGAELPTHTMINYDLNISNANLSGIDYSLFKDFLWCCYTSVITFTTLGYGDVHPIGCSRLFAAIESALGIFMTALFIFVFGRKMLR